MLALPTLMLAVIERAGGHDGAPRGLENGATWAMRPLAEVDAAAAMRRYSWCLEQCARADGGVYDGKGNPVVWRLPVLLEYGLAFMHRKLLGRRCCLGGLWRAVRLSPCMYCAFLPTSPLLPRLRLRPARSLRRASFSHQFIIVISSIVLVCAPNTQIILSQHPTSLRLICPLLMYGSPLVRTCVLEWTEALALHISLPAMPPVCP